MGGPGLANKPQGSTPVRFTGPEPVPNGNSFSVAGWSSTPVTPVKDAEIAGYVKGKRETMPLDPLKDKELISLMREAKKEGLNVEFSRGEDSSVSFSVKRKGDAERSTVRESTARAGLEEAKELLKEKLHRLLHKNEAAAAPVSPSFTGPELQPNPEPQSPAAWGPVRRYAANEIPGINQGQADVLKLDPNNQADANLIRLVAEAKFWGISCDFFRGQDGNLSFDVKRKGTHELPTIRTSTEGAQSLREAKEQLRSLLENELEKQPGRVKPSQPFSPAGYDINGLK